MLFAYNIDYDIYYEEDVIVIVREENISKKEKDRVINEMQENEKLTSYIKSLFELGYIESLVNNKADGKSISIVFVDLDGTFGPIARGARYIPQEVLNNHPRKEEYLERFHVIGNWFYIAYGRV
jgi:hypothetical protein